MNSCLELQNYAEGVTKTAFKLKANQSQLSPFLVFFLVSPQTPTCYSYKSQTKTKIKEFYSLQIS